MGICPYGYNCQQYFLCAAFECVITLQKRSGVFQGLNSTINWNYRLLFLITLKNPIAKKTALTNKNDNNTMS